MSGKDVLDFADHMMASNEPVEVGETWTLENGWRAYIRCGMKALIMKPREMRKLGEMYCGWPNAPDVVVEIGKNMIEAANAAKSKNDRHEIPEGAAEFSKPLGTA